MYFKNAFISFISVCKVYEIMSEEISERLARLEDAVVFLQKRVDALEKLFFEREKSEKFRKDAIDLRKYKNKKEIILRINGKKGSKELGEELGLKPSQIRREIKEINDRFPYIESRWVRLEDGRKHSVYILTRAGEILAEILRELEKTKTLPLE